MSGGKRVRPAVLLMAARLCGYTGDRGVLNAAVVEFIHTATLVHDDIIDGAETRRGRLTAHSRWGSDITVLLGDYLYIRSMAMALTQDTLEVVRLLCDCTLRMIEGELYQLTKTGDANITEEEHFEIIRRKTAYLFAGLRGDRRPARRLPRPSSAPRCASTASTSASRSRSWTTCWTTWRTSPRSASRSAATCAKARSRCPSSCCCSAAGRTWLRSSTASSPTARSRRSSGATIKELLGAPRRHRRRVRARRHATRERAKQHLAGGVPAVARTRRPHRARRLRARAADR